jgi:hypothetical protein
LLQRASSLAVVLDTHVDMATRIDRVVSWGPAAPAQPVTPDIALELMELPRAAGTTVETIPVKIPYIFVPKHKREYSRERLSGTKPMIGIAWAVGSINPNRSLHFNALVPILRFDQFDFVSLQRGPARDQLNGIGQQYRVRDANAVVKQFARHCR